MTVKKRIISALCIVALLLSVFYIDTQAKDGYHTIYCNNDNTYRDWGVACPDCSNPIWDTNQRNCYHALNFWFDLGNPSANGHYFGVSSVLVFLGFHNNATASSGKNLVDCYYWQGGEVPTSATDPRFLEVYSKTGVWAFAHYKGLSVVCTDNTVWTIEPEWQWIDYYGTIKGTVIHGIDEKKQVEANNCIINGKQGVISHGIDTRLFYVDSPNPCGLSQNGKFIKNAMYYLWNGGNPAGSFAGDNYYTKNVPSGTAHMKYTMGSDGQSVYFSNPGAISALEGTRSYSGYGSAAPTVALAMWNQTSRGIDVDKNNGYKLKYAGTDSLEPVWIDAATQGYELSSYTHKIKRWKCGGHDEPNTYTVKYNANGGSGTVADKACIYDTAFTLASSGFTKTDYVLKGWNTKSDGSGTTYTLGQSVKNLTTTDKGTVTLYAVWELSKFSITYDLSKGWLPSGKTNPTEYTTSTATFTLVNPQRTAYDFKGWTGTGLSSASTSVSIAKGSTGNRSYTATWSPIVYTITYNLVNGSLPSGVTNPSTYTTETPTFRLNNPSKTGYTFDGWTGSNSNIPNPTLNILQGSFANKSYTANYTPIDYTVTYDLGGGTLGSKTNPTKYNIETSTFTLNNPTKTNWQFSGWTGSNGTTPATSVSIAKGSTGNKSYTANWADVTNPSVSITASPTDWTNSNVTLTAVASDAASGLHTNAYSWEGGTYSSTKTYTVSKNGTYSVTVKDNAGNTASAQKVVSNIDKIAPTINWGNSTVRTDDSAGLYGFWLSIADSPAANGSGCSGIKSASYTVYSEDGTYIESCKLSGDLSNVTNAFDYGKYDGLGDRIRICVVAEDNATNSITLNIVLYKQSVLTKIQGTDGKYTESYIKVYR